MPEPVEARDRPFDGTAFLDGLSDDDVMYDHPVSMAGEPMDPVLFVRWDAIRVALSEPHPFQYGGLLSTTCARPDCLQSPSARIHRADRTPPEPVEARDLTAEDNIDKAIRLMVWLDDCDPYYANADHIDITAIAAAARAELAALRADTARVPEGLRGYILIRTPDDPPGHWTAGSDLVFGQPYTYSSGDVAVLVEWGSLDTEGGSDD